MVEATPTTGKPMSSSAFAPVCDPLPPMTIKPSMLALVQIGERLFASLDGLEFRAAGAAEKRSALLNDAAHVARAQRHQIVVD